VSPKNVLREGGSSVVGVPFCQLQLWTVRDLRWNVSVCGEPMPSDIQKFALARRRSRAMHLAGGASGHDVEMSTPLLLRADVSHRTRASDCPPASRVER
jgi:hypothetical protein